MTGGGPNHRGRIGPEPGVGPSKGWIAGVVDFISDEEVDISALGGLGIETSFESRAEEDVH